MFGVKRMGELIQLAQKIKKFKDEMFNPLLRELQKRVGGRYAVPISQLEILKRCVEAALAVDGSLGSAVNLLENADKSEDPQSRLDRVDWAFQEMKKAQKNFTVLLNGLTELPPQLGHLLNMTKNMVAELGALTSELWKIIQSELKQQVELYKFRLLAALNRYLANKD